MPNKDNSLSSLLDKEDDVQLKVGGDFLPSGFIGQTLAAMYYTFYTQEDSKNFDDVPAYTDRRKMGADGFRYYYAGEQDCKVAIEVMNVTSQDGRKQNPQQIWNFRIARDSVLNFADPSKLDAFGDPIVFDVNYMTYRSNKKRHEFHMIALPFAVQAVARALGYEYEPFELPELIGQNVIFTDEFQRKMVGFEKDYQDSVAWQRRTALWHSLDEEDAEAFLPIGAQSEKYVTTSKKLSKCLKIVTVNWDSALWTRMLNIPDPRVDALTKEGKRLQIPALYEIFTAKADAQTAADSDIARAKKNSDSKAASNGKLNEIAIPAGWSEFPDDWNAKSRELRAQYEKMPSTPALNKLAKEIGDVTVEELKTVWN